MFQKFLPFLIFAVSIIFSVISIRTLFIAIPAFISSLYLGYPHSVFLITVQISLLIIWGLLIIGYSRGAAHSIPIMDELPKAAMVLLIIIGFFAAASVLVLSYVNQNFDNLWELFLSCLFSGIAAASLGYFMIFYVICPLIVLEKEHIYTKITNYYRSYNRTTRGNHYICFEDTPKDTHYRVSMFSFAKFRNKVGAPVSYIKYKCPFDVYFIRKLSIKDMAGSPSEWETSAYTKAQRNFFNIALIFAIISILLFLVIFGIAGILPWQN